MAGMLPGVECARRRRFHQGGAATELQTGTRRSSFCLYRSGHDSHLISSTSLRSAFNKSTPIEGLGDAAREARERLDERLRAQPASEIRRHDITGSSRHAGGGRGGDSNQGVPVSSGAALAKLQREVFCPSKKGGSGRHGRFTIGWWWKAAAAAAEEEDEEEDDGCAVCLEEFRGGDVLVYLPCAHRFHRRCVLPWLESSSRCPCCRTDITS